LKHNVDSVTTDVKISHTPAKHVKQNAPKWLQLLGTIRVFVAFSDS